MLDFGILQLLKSVSRKKKVNWRKTVKAWGTLKMSFHIWFSHHCFFANTTNETADPSCALCCCMSSHLFWLFYTFFVTCSFTSNHCCIAQLSLLCASLSNGSACTYMHALQGDTGSEPCRPPPSPQPLMEKQMRMLTVCIHTSHAEYITRGQSQTAHFNELPSVSVTTKINTILTLHNN